MMRCLALSIGCAALALSACSTVRVTTDYDPEADFSALSTYLWNPGPQPETGDPRLDNSLLEGRIKRAVDKALVAKGYRAFDPAGGGEPDFHVGYHAAIAGKLDVQTINDYYGYGTGWGWNYGMGPGAGWRGAPETYVRQYDEGTLLIDVSSPANNQLMWRGSGETELEEGDRAPDDREKDLDEMVAKILAKFPPSPD